MRTYVCAHTMCVYVYVYINIRCIYIHVYAHIKTLPCLCAEFVYIGTTICMCVFAYMCILVHIYSTYIAYKISGRDMLLYLHPIASTGWAA